MITVNTTAGYTTTQRTMAREGLDVHDAGCCTPGARCWMAQGLERIVNSTHSTVVMVPVADSPLSRGNGAGRGRSADVATDSQLRYIRSMLTELADTPDDFPGNIARDMVAAQLGTGNPMTKRTASDVIGKLKSSVDILRVWKTEKRRTERAASPVVPNVPVKPVTEGMYELDGSVYRVKMSGAGRLYAMLLMITDGEGSFEYAQGVIRRIRPEHRMSLERASELSVRYHFCVRCAKELTKKSSVAQGMGDTCASKM